MIFLLWVNLAVVVFAAVVVVLLCWRFETFLSVMAQRGAEVVEEEEARIERRRAAAKKGWERRRELPTIAEQRANMRDLNANYGYGTQQYQDEP